MAGATRLELATSGVTGRRSNQTELRPHIFFCVALILTGHYSIDSQFHDLPA